MTDGLVELDNGRFRISCRADGRGFAVADLVHGQDWVLDWESLAYGQTGEDPFWQPVGPRQPLRPLRAERTGPDSVSLVCSAGGAELRVRYALKDDYIECSLGADTDASLAFVTLPGSFSAADGRQKHLFPIMQGMLWNGSGGAFDWVKGEGSHQGFSMPFFGLIGTKGGLLVEAESRDDCRWWFGKAPDGRRWATNVQLRSAGSFRYGRAVRMYAADADIAALAKRYRARVKERGEFVSWEEKIARRPALERVFGALMCYIGYCEDDIDYLEGCRKLKAYGFDRALLYPGRFNVYSPGIRMAGVPAIDIPRETVEAIKALGYDMAPWSWIMEALDDGSEGIRRMLRMSEAGAAMPNWKIDDNQWYHVCHSFMEDFQKKALASGISDMSWDHFDVLAALPPSECHAKDHAAHPGRPSTRSEDREYIKATFRADQAAGLMVSSECFNDAYSRELDFGSVKTLPQFGPWPFWPVPLTMLVYHDSMVHSWYELHSYNNAWRGRTAMNDRLFEYGGGRPKLMATMDALMGCPPDVFPFGAQYGYSGKGTDTFLYKYRFEDPEVQIALREALPVARLHRRVGKLELVHFGILDEDGYVQESAFSDGTHVVANFSRDFVGSVKGIDHKVIPGIRPIAPESWMAE
jgi:hypothetical protein